MSDINTTLNNLLSSTTNKEIEMSRLNEYTGEYSNDSGTLVPVTVIAKNIVEAAKLFSTKGAYLPNDKVDPQRITFVKGSIGVAVPIHTIGFYTNVYPTDIITSGGYATPVHYDVPNSTDVIFTAHEPFNGLFKGWYKGTLEECVNWVEGNPNNLVENSWLYHLLATTKVANINVYDSVATKLNYIARFEKYYTLRNGLYKDIAPIIGDAPQEYHGGLFRIELIPDSSFIGTFTINTPDVEPYYSFGIKNIIVPSTNTIGTIVIGSNEDATMNIAMNYTFYDRGIIISFPSGNPPAFPESLNLNWTTSTKLDLKWDDVLSSTLVGGTPILVE